MNDNDKPKLVGLDIGTTKITCVAAIVNEFGEIEVIGVGTAPSLGMTKGMVNNMEQTVNSISKAVAEAQRVAGCKLEEVYVGIAGGHISSFNSKGIIAVKDNENRLITEEDKERAMEAAKTVNLPQARIITQSIPQEYKVDEVDGILDPAGMVGVRLEVNVHIITAAENAYHNIVNCVGRADLSMRDIVLESLASAEAVLSPQEMDSGVAILDIGGGTTDIAIFCGGVIKHSAVIPIGGNNVTSDLATVLRTSFKTAEDFKVKYGCCHSSLANSKEEIVVPSLGGFPQTFAFDYLTSIQEKRMEELLDLACQEFVNSGYDELVNEVVLTGGTSLLPGLPELARDVICRPARLGVPHCEGGLASMVNDPRNSTAIGLILHGLRNDKEASPSFSDPGGKDGSFWAKAMRRVRNFVAAD
ncbi:MAG: cell division protein FtsA [Deltaproteobacteria bacterium]|jgi:cell division protein FtsA|nr:cell division protein FtsA [Deltaproteobacteria bacterium]